MYIKRTLETSIKSISKFFPVVLVTGPRQVGKTTVLQNCAKSARAYVSLDTLENRELAKKDPALFLQRFPAPVLIDEIQYAKELLPYIKEIVDKEKKPGMFWLTGSQQFHLMKEITETLAGRVGILNLQGLSQDEKENRAKSLSFLPTAKYIKNKATLEPKTNLKQIYERIWKGSYPKLYPAKNTYWEVFYDSYLQTYIERDIRSLSAVSNVLNFVKFMRILAARTAQLINYTEIAGEIGVTTHTIQAWVSILKTSGIIYILHPYSNNLSKRLIKTPKIYFMDTGLVSYLTGWKTPQTLEAGAMSGALMETYAVSEIIKSYLHNGRKPNIYYYRDKDKREIDILLEQDGTFYPIEIKKKSNPNTNDIKAFKAIDNLKLKCGEGAVLCLANTHLPITKNVMAIPIGYL